MAAVTTRRMRNIRHLRVRQRVAGGPDRPRLCVFRSLRHIYAQIIDDKEGKTLASASSKDEAVSQAGKALKKDVAFKVGRLLAEKARGRGIGRVVFDRGGYKYQGRVKALADGAREGGLSF